MNQRHDLTGVAPATTKLVHLEAARGIASVIVLFHHFAIAFVPNLKANIGSGGLEATPLYLLFNGTLAVYFFFVLSGFVLTFRFYQGTSLRRLYGSVAKRLPRLWLPVALSILLGLVFLTLGADSAARNAGALTGSDWLASFGNALRPDRHNPSIPDALRQSVAVFLHRFDFYYNSNLWTMVYEFWGSILVFALVFVVHMARARLTSVAILGLQILLMAALAVLGHPQFAAFVAGSAIAYHMAGRDTPLVFGRPIIIILLFVFIAGGSFGPGPTGIPELASAIAAMLLLLPATRLAQRFSGPLGEWLGHLSFPMYLVHTLVVVGPASWLFITLNGQMAQMSVLFIIFGVVAILSMVLALPLVYIDRYWTRTINRVFHAHIAGPNKAKGQSET